MASLERLTSGDLSKKTTAELQELLERQQKLLANRKFIASLPDKGEKIMKFKNTLENMLDKRQNVNSIADMFSSLRISTKALSLKIVEDDDSTNINESETTVWETLASNGLPTKITNMQSDSEKNIKTSMKNGDNLNVFYNHLAKAVDSLKETKDSTLKLHKTLRSTDIPKQPLPQVTQKTKITIEENSAVRYPVGPHKETKLLSMEESLALQKQNIERFQQLQIRQAAEQLAMRANIRLRDYVPDPITKISYREQSPEEETDSESDFEELD